MNQRFARGVVVISSSALSRVPLLWRGLHSARPKTGGVVERRRLDCRAICGYVIGCRDAWEGLPCRGVGGFDFTSWSGLFSG